MDIKLFFLPLFLAALMDLKRKKKLEKQLQQTDVTASNIECWRKKLENALTNTEVLMRNAAETLKAAHQHL